MKLVLNKTYKVLAADDEYWVRENLRTILNWGEYSFEFIEPAVDGEDVLRKMQDCPDIVITDINMPFINGVELVKIIKEQYPQVVTVILSGYNDFIYVRESLLAGAIDYLLKPLNKVDLIHVLSKAVEKIGRDQSIKETLLEASYILRDKEFSAIITMDEADFEKTESRSLSDMELDFTGFSLILIKIQNINTILKNKYKSRISELSFDIQGLIENSLRDKKQIVFNNIYAPNEYIAITEWEPDALSEKCGTLLEGLGHFTDSMISIAISKHYFSLKNIRKAYHEAISAFMAREYRPGNSIITTLSINCQAYKKRMTAEQENELMFGIRTKNVNIVKNVALKQIGLTHCDDGKWLFIEVKKTVDRIINIIVSTAADEVSPFEIASMENLIELMDRTLESFSAEEVCSVLEQIIDEALGLTTNLSGINDTMNETVKLVADYIDKNYYEPLSLSVLSKLFLVESSYLSRAFRQDIGDNLMLYIAKKRIEKAIQLIKEGELSLTDISYLVGYDEYSYFNRVFRKVTGKSPSEYKARKEIE